MGKGTFSRSILQFFGPTCILRNGSVPTPHDGTARSQLLCLRPVPIGLSINRFESNDMKKLMNKVASSLGYDVKKQHLVSRNGFELYRYCKTDGSFDYDKYRQVQTAGNKRKIKNVWVREENIAFVSEYILSKIGDVKFGLCHGTRRGKEQEWFGKHLNCEVLGTEISDTAEQFPNTIQWDFHEVKPEWIESVDFIYSNSFDHSYDPEKCLQAWMSCIRPGGVCLIEHSSCNHHATKLDPFVAYISLMTYLVLTWGKGKFFVRQLLDAPSAKDSLNYIQYLVIQKA